MSCTHFFFVQLGFVELRLPWLRRSLIFSYVAVTSRIASWTEKRDHDSIRSKREAVVRPQERNKGKGRDATCAILGVSQKSHWSLNQLIFDFLSMRNSMRIWWNYLRTIKNLKIIFKKFKIVKKRLVYIKISI